MKRWLLNASPAVRSVVGLATGWLTWTVVLLAGLGSLQLALPGYAEAVPEKAYTLPMQIARLVVFGLAVAGTAGVARFVTGSRRMMWAAAGIILGLSIPDHLYPGYVWDDYPAWYHYTYLVSIVPLALLGGAVAGRIGSRTTA